MKIGLVVLDTLRYDVFSDVMESTIDRIDYVFDQMHSTSRWTVPAHASLFTGYYPTEVGTHSHNHHLTTSKRTIAEQFANAGYTTFGYSNNPYIDSFFEFDRGFDTLYRGPVLEGRPTEATAFDWPALFSELSNGIKRYPEAAMAILKSDAPTIQTAVNGLRLLLTSESLTKADSLEWIFNTFHQSDITSYDNLFIFSNIMTCHSPYNPPRKYRTTEPYLVDPLELTLRDEPVTEAEHERHWDCYTGAAEYLDDQLGRIIDFCDWDMLFIVSDHGELFGEHGLRQHQYGVYEELVHVPAVAVGSAVPSGRTSSLSSLVDIHQTLLDFASLPTDDTRGINLFDEDETRESVYAESVGNYRYSPDSQGFNAKIPASWAEPHYMYRTNEMKFIKDKDGERITTEDNRTPEENDAKSLRERVKRFRNQFNNNTTKGPQKELTEDIEAQLKHLGYK